MICTGHNRRNLTSSASGTYSITSKFRLEVENCALFSLNGSSFLELNCEKEYLVTTTNPNVFTKEGEIHQSRVYLV